ncbi:hypothetical protein SEA_ZITCH_4 [Gordonia Phage Zitch]|uniref:Uncharacterized protein n=1 Tax=Gordonia Phage Zitch TaxID=2743909 RepID=A0A7G3V9F6_9CAUD|nr:hypothetical protein J1774_gp04 [Gordonia Phage Zitch]QKY78451.1 hypothetical protein SEA_ZITCH_4 [Gordonia Phage Zitch]
MTAVTARVSWFAGDMDEITGYNIGGGRHMVACMISHETPKGDVISSPALCSTADVIIERVPEQDGQYMLALPTPRPRRRRRRRTVPSPAGDQFLLFDTAS